MRRVAIPSSPEHEASAALGSDVSHQPVQPTSCHENPLDPQLPSVRLSPLRSPQPVHRLGTRLHANANVEPFRTTPDSRRRHFWPWVETCLTARQPTEAAYNATGYPKGDPWAGRNSPRLCRPNTSPMRRSQTPSVAPSTRTGCPSFVEKARICSARTASTARTPQIQGVFHRQVPRPSLRACTPRADQKAATDLPALPPESSVRHAFTHALCARPTSYRLFARPERHVPPTDFCSWETHEHTHVPSKPCRLPTPKRRACR